MDSDGFKPVPRLHLDTDLGDGVTSCFTEDHGSCSERPPSNSTTSTRCPDFRDKEELQLFVLVHGICGSADDWSEWIERIRCRQHPNWIVVAASRITPECQFIASRLEALAKLLSEEVSDILQELLSDEETSRDEESDALSLRTRYQYFGHSAAVGSGSRVTLNFLCHSLGGLITRASLPEISKLPALEAGQVTLGSFVTLNSPHLGTCPSSAVTAWKGLCRFNELHRQINLLDARLGAHSEDLGLLEKLAEPSSEFHEVLLMFQHRTAVAATRWDIIVPFCSAAICPTNPFPSTSPTQPAFWRIDAALDFEESSVLAREVEENACEIWKSSMLEFDTSTVDSSEIHTWHTERRVQFPMSMYRNLTSACWRRVAFTVHHVGAQVHTFSLGKQQVSAHVHKWSIEFIDTLLDMIEEDSGDEVHACKSYKSLC
mmetsp:Transcript_34124/g.61790  ORF Transcript_34124/g.61790 Transcript_34124/m.61790 type:complete len:431 (+) Transcript_34124:63-1355(+)